MFYSIKDIPWSLRWFLITGVVYLLQLFPYTGIFLMFLVAPAWSIVTINLGFLCLLFEAWSGRINRAWLLPPVAWFGGYACLALLSHQKASSLDAELRGANAAQHLAFDPDERALVFAGRPYVLSGAAPHFVQHYRVPVAYQATPDIKPLGHRAARVLPGDTCTVIRNDRTMQAAGVQGSFVERPGERRQRQRETTERLCLVTMPERPALPIVLVEGRDEKQKGLLLPYELTHLTIGNSGHPPMQVTAGTVQVLRWLPLPVMGCGLNSGAAKWECFADFLRRRVPVGGEGEYGGAALTAIAAALGLEKVHATDRREEIAAAPFPSLQGVAEANLGRSLAVVDEVLADPKRRITIHDVKGLDERPDLLRDRMPALVGAVRRSLATGRATYETGRVLQGILARLPASDFDGIGAEMVAMLEAQAALDVDMVDQAMAIRLGSLGAPALPVLEKLAFSRPHSPFVAAIYGLCRIGADAALHADSLYRLGRPDRRNRELDAAVYVTLLRLGRSDLIEREAGEGGRFARIDKRLVARGITPQSPPEVCTNEREWPRVPA